MSFEGKKHSEETKIKMGISQKGNQNGKATQFQKGDAAWNEGTAYADHKPQYETKMIGGKQWLVHQVIWILHNGLIPAGYIIHHKDFNPKNNDINNLQLVTRGEHASIHNEHAKSIRKPGYTQKELNEINRDKGIEQHRHSKRV